MATATFTSLLNGISSGPGKQRFGARYQSMNLRYFMSLIDKNIFTFYDQRFSVSISPTFTFVIRIRRHLPVFQIHYCWLSTFL